MVNFVHLTLSMNLSIHSILDEPSNGDRCKLYFETHDGQLIWDGDKNDVSNYQLIYNILIS